MKNTQYKKAKWRVLSSHLQIIQADHFKERCKNQIILTKAQQSFTTTEYATVTMDMFHNILLNIFKGEQPGPTYYLLPENIYGLGIHDASNNICLVYTWAEFEGMKGMNNISYFLLCWINYKGCYSKYMWQIPLLP